jgi:hypothetical protein
MALKRTGPIKRKTPLKAAQYLTKRIVKNNRAKVTAAERNARKVVRTRSGGICEICGNAQATNFGHRKNRSQGGQWSASNGLDLCGSGTTGCHGHATVNPALARSRGWAVLSTDDPAEMPVFLASQGWVFLLDDGSTTPQESAA